MPAHLFQRRRRLFVPEVVQTSAMDCGPASLKCLLEGFHIPASYGRLREACQTDVDGTSIDTLEEIAGQLELAAEQVMVPLDHLLLPGAEVLPAIIVVRRANNATHFLVAWRRHGPVMQLMDPAVGRLWLSVKNFLAEIYIHTMPIAAASWFEWAASDAFCGALGQRLALAGMSAGQVKWMIDAARTGASWRPLAALDAATRMTEAIVRAGGIRRGRPAARVIERFALRAQDETADATAIIPADFWSAQPALPSADGEAQVMLRGAVLVHVRGRQTDAKPTGDLAHETNEDADASDAAATESDDTVAAHAKTRLPPELAAALAEKPSRPGLELLRLLRADGRLTPFVLLCALALATGGVVVEALLFRGLFDIGRELNLSGQRLGAIGALIVFVTLLLLLELPIVATVLRLGRRLETRLRMRFMDKIPRLSDRYFHSRLTSDMTERSHSIQRIRQLPDLGARLLRLSFELLLTTLGIIWLDPASAPYAVLAAALAVAVPLAAQPVLLERDLRLRNHGGGLSRFYLDALIGLFAVRAHGAERAVRRAHEDLLLEWAGAGLSLQRAVVAVEGVQFCVGFGLSVWLLFHYFTRAGESGGLLLFIYWVLNVPVLGQEIGLITRQYPDYRNVTLRLLEPLGALEETDAPPATTTAQSATFNAPLDEPALAAATQTSGMSVVFNDVNVRAAGHTILENIDLKIAAGEHVAIVGSSGAGKSSLVGVLLGWHRPASGAVLIDGRLLHGADLEQLRREIAWVDPTVQLWHRPFIDNLRYGAQTDSTAAISRAIESADLLDVLAKLPDGLQTSLGEGGALVSGGQGQRVRLGRAMLRAGARLVILDEPFRGLERPRRRKLLTRARELWRAATLVCITHDVGETRSFPRVIVIHEGHIVEDGPPEQLIAVAGSRYQALLAAEEEVRAGMWASHDWRRLALQDKRLVESRHEAHCACATCQRDVDRQQTEAHSDQAAIEI